MDTTTQDPVDLTEDERHNLRLIGFDVGAALAEAVKPKRARRNIRIEELGIRVYTDGVAHLPVGPALMEAEVRSDIVTETGATQRSDGMLLFSPGFTGDELLSVYVGAHLFHGWTLDSRTSTEAVLSKEAP